MADIGFVWDEDKYDRVRRRHRVGRTPSGRMLVVVYSDAELPMCRSITAFDAEGRYRDEYFRV